MPAGSRSTAGNCPPFHPLSCTSSLSASVLETENASPSLVPDLVSTFDLPRRSGGFLASDRTCVALRRPSTSEHRMMD